MILLAAQRYRGFILILVFFFASALVVFLLLLWFLQKFYVQATLSSSLVRTGLGGLKVLLDGGCFALPIIHKIQPVSMSAYSLKVSLKDKESVLTEDQLRADIEMEFEFRVESTKEAVAIAAQSFGSTIARSGEGVLGLLKGPVADLIQKSAAARKLSEIHHDREGYTHQVEQAVAEKAQKYGLLLISASLLSVDQTDLNILNEGNVFDSVGMRRLAELMSEQRRERNRIEVETELEIRENQMKKFHRTLEIESSEREANILQKATLEQLDAQTMVKTQEVKNASELVVEIRKNDTEKQVELAKIDNDEVLRRAEMAAILDLEETRITDRNKLALLKINEMEVQVLEEEARAHVLITSEQTQTKRDLAIATREAEVSELKLLKSSELDLARAKNRSQVSDIQVGIDAQAASSLAQSNFKRTEAEANGRAAQIKAENTMSEIQVHRTLEQLKLETMPAIYEQMMKPVEKIDSIKINQISGLSGHGGSKDSGGEGAFGSAMEQILGMAVRLPAMKQMGEEIGLDFDTNLAGRTADYANRIKKKEEE
ncbi:MAG: flotillin [Candidatus Azotimanducaceae bacterium]